MLWVPVTLLATLAQTGRNAAQAGLTRQIGTAGATQVRFLFGLPFALLFLALVVWFGAEPPPVPGLRSLGFTLIGALAQIGATALMLVTMKSQSFAVTTAWLKTEPVLVALIAWAVLGDALTLPAMAAIALATVGVLVRTVRPGARLTALRPALTGLAAAGLFGLSAIGFRGGITALDSGGQLIRATTTLVISLALQSAILGLWMAFYARSARRATFGVWRQSLLAVFLGACLLYTSRCV